MFNAQRNSVGSVWAFRDVADLGHTHAFMCLEKEVLKSNNNKWCQFKVER